MDAGGNKMRGINEASGLHMGRQPNLALGIGRIGMSATTKVSSKWQVVIPAEVRKAIHVEEGDNLVFEVIDESTAVVRVIRSQPLMSLFGALPPKTDQPEVDFPEIRREARQAVTEKNFSERND